MALSFLAGLAAIAVLALLSTFLIWSDVRRQGHEAEAMGIVADQIVLSYDVERRTSREGIDSMAITAEMHAGIDALLNGDAERGLAATAGEEMAPALRAANRSIQEMGRAFGEGDIAAATEAATHHRSVLDHVLTGYRESAEARSDSTQQRQVLLLGAMLVLLAAEALFLIRPLTKRIAARLHHQERQVADSRSRVDYLTAYDRLTGLANRTMASRRLQTALNRAKDGGGMVTLLTFNLDGFGSVNDRYGTDIGDGLLVAVAKRIKHVVRESDTVARLGGDEFAVILEGGTRVEDIGTIAAKILNSLAAPHMVGDNRIFTSASCGVVIYPLDGDDVEGLFRDAGIALAAAKASGRNTYRFFTTELRERTSERLTLIDGLRRALDQTDELRLVYQPKINLATGEVIGVEALIRWEHPDLGTILPGRFIPLAEETDLIIPLGKWVLNRAVAQAREWADRGVAVSINVSSRQFRHGDLVEMVAEALHTFDLDAEQLEVELTEGTLIEDVEAARETLHRLKEMGVKVSIDDFGTGYSSLSYLKRFPIDTLKIDRSFIDEITVDPDDAAISQAIVSLARSLRMQVIAEGVETDDQLRHLREMGCDAVQGYIFSRPLPPESIEDFVVASRPQAATG